MTDRTLTPEVYGDFGLFLDQIGFRTKDQRSADRAASVPADRPLDREPRSVDWYKRGEDCPF